MARRALGPATLAVVAAIEDAHRGEDVLVACSGGADSVALAHGARLAAGRRGFAARAVVVDHGLQEGSAAQASRVAAGLTEAGLPADVVRVRVTQDGSGPEAAARTARYRALADAGRPVELCYLGHTRDDQAETVLLGLARGSGPRSLAGMARRRDGFVRPLLDLTRTTTRQCCDELGLDWWEDPHNTERRFARVRVREVVLPVLERELGPGVAAALARTASLAREDADALDQLAAAIDAPAELPCAVLEPLPAALRQRVLRRWLLARGATQVGRAHTLAVAALVTDWHGQRWVEVPGLKVVRSSGVLVADFSLRPPSL
ncbi:MAG: tRNA lysidine(34) synthetase TilS [Micropruina sp.]|uniref:tRNA lysidine(34) synthetase TilS n=1 Tax=Micropruina sp. TaxID=2737536 RepID=UPI0039E38D95